MAGRDSHAPGGGALILLSIGANAAGVSDPIVHFIVGALVWLSFLKSGVHATLASVLMAFTTPAHVRLDAEPFFARLAQLRESFTELGISGSAGSALVGLALVASSSSGKPGQNS